MYYGVEDFLEKTAKTRFAKEFLKTYDDFQKLKELPKSNIVYDAARRAYKKALRLRPYNIHYNSDLGYTYRLLKGEVRDTNYKNLRLRKPNRFPPARSIDPRSKKLQEFIKGNSGYQDIRNLLSKKDQAVLNSVSKADRDLINKYRKK